VFPVATVTQIINNMEISLQNLGFFMVGACKPMETGAGSCGMVLPGPGPAGTEVCVEVLLRTYLLPFVAVN